MSRALKSARRRSGHEQVIAICASTAITAMAAVVALLLGQQIWPDSVNSGWHLHVAVDLATLAISLDMFLSFYGKKEVDRSFARSLEASRAKAQTDELFVMTDMLQCTDTHEDATAVLIATARRLLPDYGVALYVFNNSRDRLDLTGRWNMPEDSPTPDTLAASNCWALKHGKPHINDHREATLCCAHHSGMTGTLEVPMMARGTVHGLLIFACNAGDSFCQLLAIRRLCRALADSMSLALSNIALREKLRTQSLRDPLTGLYNRRYMEDALERYISLSERTGAATCVVMVDLDNFKRLNDEHGHAKGDAVLRDVASQMVGGLRPSDIVCRYGGEELMVILPNCGIEDAAAKTEILRTRIEALSELHGAAITASFGVAGIPECATAQAELVAMADAALYRAKNAGKNRVVIAERRATAGGTPVRLTATG